MLPEDLPHVSKNPTYVPPASPGWPTEQQRRARKVPNELKGSPLLVSLNHKHTHFFSIIQ